MKSYDIPAIEPTFKGRLKTILMFWKYGLPNGLMPISFNSCDLISFHYIGTSFQDIDQAAFGLTNTWYNCFGLQIIYAMSAAMSTFAG